MMAVQQHPRQHAGFHRPSWQRRQDASTSAPDQVTGTAATTSTAACALAGTRFLLGFVFLWAFFDKLFGWGYATSSGQGWIDGGSPTKGFLSGVSAGPMQSTFHAWAGSGVVDWLFMLGLLGIGAALVSGVALRLTAVAGSAMMAFMWMAEWPLARHLANGSPSQSSNPIVDYHVMFAAIMITLAVTAAGSTWGLGRHWARLPLVSEHRWLR